MWKKGEPLKIQHQVFCGTIKKRRGGGDWTLIVCILFTEALISVPFGETYTQGLTVHKVVTESKDQYFLKLWPVD